MRVLMTWRIIIKSVNNNLSIDPKIYMRAHYGNVASCNNDGIWLWSVWSMLNFRYGFPKYKHQALIYGDGIMLLSIMSTFTPVHIETNECTRYVCMRQIIWNLKNAHIQFLLALAPMLEDSTMMTVPLFRAMVK